ncbi:MAG: hypothetical protein KGO50_11950, partial [Myxococcales bacterium]|nr:hypothetical protein [Myxococcales bacterium]
MKSIRNHASVARGWLLVMFGVVSPSWLVSCGQAPESSLVSDTGSSTDADVVQIPIADVPTVGGDDVDGGSVDVDGRADVDAGGADGLGTLCDDESDCVLPLTCVFPDVGAPTGVCTSACTETADCPSGWRCYTLTDSGSDAVRQCLPENLCIDGDGDGYGWGGGCGGRDCDDTLDTINPAADELCNALDDDCDGRIDDNSIEDRTDCDTGFTGACAVGRNSCTNGTLDCVPVESTEVELCDALDNDCDGQVDEGDVCAGEPCCFGDSCLGVCGEATTAADGSCAAPESWGDDVCDGLDNDCDGVVDNAVPNEGVACAAEAPGLCAAGQIACREAGLVCIAASPSTESCDAADNDCDGEIDEDGVCGVTPCCFGDDCDGVCGVSILADDGTCEAPAAYGAEVCDGLDNDCNGLVDDAIAEEGTPCATGAPGVCFAGRAVCVSGDLQCEADVLASAEICDGLDNDCDGTPDDDDACTGEPCCFADL